MFFILSIIISLILNQILFYIIIVLPAFEMYFISLINQHKSDIMGMHHGYISFIYSGEEIESASNTKKISFSVNLNRLVLWSPWAPYPLAPPPLKVKSFLIPNTGYTKNILGILSILSKYQRHDPHFC